jgi:thymidine phosphorylase
VYGSNDGGQTVKDENEMFRQKMEQIGQLLNLKKHRAGNTDKHLIGPVDMGNYNGSAPVHS